MRWSFQKAYALGVHRGSSRPFTHRPIFQPRAPKPEAPTWYLDAQPQCLAAKARILKIVGIKTGMYRTIINVQLKYRRWTYGTETVRFVVQIICKHHLTEYGILGFHSHHDSQQWILGYLCSDNWSNIKQMEQSFKTGESIGCPVKHQCEETPTIKQTRYCETVRHSNHNHNSQQKHYQHIQNKNAKQPANQPNWSSHIPQSNQDPLPPHHRSEPGPFSPGGAAQGPWM